MKRPAPEKSDESASGVRLLLHGVDGTIPFMTPYLLRKYVPPSNDFWVGIAVRDTCVVPQYRTDKKNKPCGYTFCAKKIDSFLSPYNRVTVPSFNLLQDAKENDSRKQETGVVATDQHVLVWTTQGRQKLTSALHLQVARGLDSHASIPLYDVALESENIRRKEAALRRNVTWLTEFEKEKNVWAPLVITDDSDANAEQVEQIQLHDWEGIVVVGWHTCEDPWTERLKACIEAMDEPPKVLAVLSTRTTSEFLEAARAGINMIGSAFPATWAKAKHAFVVDLLKHHSSTKRARREEDADQITLDADGCMDMDDKRWARDVRPLMPGCKCMACSTPHSRAYIHHLVQAKELVAEILLFAHNLHHLQELCRALSSDMDGVYDTVMSQLKK